MSWGFLMGAGKGLQGAASSYGRIMDEKRTQDFQLKRDEISFERQKSLQQLGFEHSDARANQSREWSLDDQERARQNQLEDRAEDRANKEKDIETGFKMWEKKTQLGNQYAMELYEMQSEFKKAETQEERDRQVEELTELFGELDPQEKLILATVQTGVDLTSLGKNNNIKMNADLFKSMGEMLMMTGEINDKSTSDEVVSAINGMLDKLNTGGYKQNVGQKTELASQEQVQKFAADFRAGNPEALADFPNLAPKSQEMVKMEAMKQEENGGVIPEHIPADKKKVKTSAQPIYQKGWFRNATGADNGEEQELTDVQKRYQEAKQARKAPRTPWQQ